MPDAALSTLLSLCAADALGAATEFKTPEVIHARYTLPFDHYQEGSVFGFAPGEATDDSQMVVATLLGYARGEGTGGVWRALQEWLATGPPDVGGLTRAALQHAGPDGGVHAWEASGFQSAGNGGLMRVAAAWIAGFRGDDLARESAVLTALTHADPRCVHASVVLTACMEALSSGGSSTDAAAHGLRVMDALNAEATLLDAGLFSTATLRAQMAFRGRDREARASVRGRVRAGLDGLLTSQSGFVLDTLEAALKHARAGSWLECVQPAVLLGDDSDTVACVVGALAGARGLPVPGPLLAPLRLGHSWPDWKRDWLCLEHLPDIVQAAQRA
ncbi:ADP-ribosylglycohydrolase [Deinococcus malanensis]|uniref:ADP-ribosylglycohydrolase n=1 Tax=Deinococcus malanensis TaxID=1706855 RepID=A0ABQ2EJR8_9DEIO|nr:ADP-ribosylglycohydrolase family protein [Deinococcus malanensis]GGK12105.1 ADP-ribosylglycohydrolase [Deinococcus malanensis]